MIYTLRALRNFIAVAIFLTVTVFTFTGCKTTEKNYRQAYERTVNSGNPNNVTDFNQTIYGRQRSAARDVAGVTSSGDTINTRVTAVAVTPDGGGINEWLKRYNVCVGEFKQLFNAKSLRTRFVDAGYPRSFIVQNSEPYYYILAGSYDTLDQAVEALKALESANPITLQIGFPYILQIPRH